MKNEELIELVKNLNQSWINRDYEKLGTFFHKEVTTLLPGSNEFVIGKENFVQSFRSFMENTEIENYEEDNFGVQEWGCTAMVGYNFRIVYKMESEIYDESGTDIYFFTKENSKWEAVWRTMIMAEQ